jgi:hypothetical protein
MAEVIDTQFTISIVIAENGDNLKTVASDRYDMSTTGRSSFATARQKSGKHRFPTIDPRGHGRKTGINGFSPPTDSAARENGGYGR